MLAPERCFTSHECRSLVLRCKSYVRLSRACAGGVQLATIILNRTRLKEFYRLPENTLWVTMADGHFWWAFAKGRVVGVEPGKSYGPARYRLTKAGWSKTSLTGDPLTVRSLSSALTRTAGYQMTICAIEREDYLLRRIRGEGDPLHARATALRVEMR